MLPCRTKLNANKKFNKFLSLLRFKHILAALASQFPNILFVHTTTSYGRHNNP